MRFPPSFLERLRAQLTVSEVIGRRVAIKKHGREFQALCPFHNEKTPSFTINDDKGFFHCFGCAAHGDAIGFVMRYERMTYPEAVEKLARDYGIPLPQLTPEESRKAEAEKTQLGILEAACRWFEEQLPKNTTARAYVEKRGLDPETVRTFRIGYAPEERTALHQHLLKSGFPLKEQQEAGLIIVPEEGGIYDRFRGRLMFPIRSPRGDVFAFGGRLIVENANKSLPKYLNSPETALFKKGEMLYNLDLAKRPAREKQRAVVLEGYMDVVSVAQAGVDYAVATLGTAVTPEHLKRLWQLCKEPVLCLDGDAAGARAMNRAAEIALPLLQPGCSLRFAILPQGEDPDSYVQKFGRASFENVLASAKPLYQSLWEELWRQHKPKLNLPEGRAGLEAACRRIAETIADVTVKKHYADYFERQLWEQVRKAPRTGNAGRALQVTHLSNLENPQGAALDRLAARMLQLLVDCPALLHKSAVEEIVSHLDLRDAPLVSLRDALLSSLEQPAIENRETLLAYLEKTLPDFTPISAKSPNLDAEQALQHWNESVTVYRITELQNELQTLQENTGNNVDEAAHARMVELQNTLKKAQSLRTFAPNASDAA